MGPMTPTDRTPADLLHAHGKVVVRRAADPRRPGIVENRRECDACGHALPWSDYGRAVAEHQADVLHQAGMLTP